MKRIRLPVSVLIAWLFVFYNIERLSLEGVANPVDISQVAYLLVPVAAIAISIFPLQRVPLALMATGFVALYFPLQLLFGLWFGDLALFLRDAPGVSVEVGALILTCLLARWVSLGVAEFELAVVNITLGQVGERRSRQGEMYREVRRARTHHRPLTLMAIKPDQRTLRVAVDRMVQEAQEAMIRQYVQASISKTLTDELDDYNLIARGKDHFLVLLPEISPDKLPDLEQRLHRVVAERVGVSVQISAATLSRDITTFEGLMQKALEGFRPDDSPPKSPVTTGLSLDKVMLTEGVNGRQDV
jgi:GGDEF domain-containing protein